MSIEGEQLGFSRAFPAIGPESLLGIEINPYAAELARVSVWIGEIQWMRRNGFNVGRKPILRPLDTIECRNAIINDDGSQAWPAMACRGASIWPWSAIAGRKAAQRPGWAWK